MPLKAVSATQAVGYNLIQSVRISAATVKTIAARHE